MFGLFFLPLFFSFFFSFCWRWGSQGYCWFLSPGGTGEACCCKRTQVEPCYPQFNLPTGGQREVGRVGAHHSSWSLKEQRGCRGGDGGERDGCCLSPQLDSRAGDEALLACFSVIMKPALRGVVN